MTADAMHRVIETNGIRMPCLTVPALYVVGDLDLTMGFGGAAEQMANLSQFVPQLRKTIMLPGCGHWTQQERAIEVNEAMIAFLREP
jgi:pimeloyl-ACP methyl ester carboxylesterase